MKATTLFVIAAMIVATFSISAIAQTKDSTKATVVKVAKPIGARIYTPADLDTLKAKLAALDDSEPVTVGMLREAMSFTHDVTLKDGHKEYVSMPNFFKKQVTKTIAAKFDTVTTNVNTVSAKADTAMKTANTAATAANAVSVGLTKLTASVNDLAYFAKGLDQSVTNLQLVAIGDKTLVPIPEGVRAVVRTEDATMEAQEVAMELIRQEVAAKRAKDKK